MAGAKPELRPCGLVPNSRLKTETAMAVAAAAPPRPDPPHALLTSPASSSPVDARTRWWDCVRSTRVLCCSKPWLGLRRRISHTLGPATRGSADHAGPPSVNLRSQL